jgi:Lon protease-like protein
MSLVDGREMASVGTLLRIERHERMPNGTLVVLTRGGRRFRVVRVVKQQPVLICEVAWVDDALKDEMGEDDDFTLPEVRSRYGHRGRRHASACACADQRDIHSATRQLAEEVRILYRTTVQLSNKVNAGKGEPVVEEAPDDGLSPQEASFWYMRCDRERPAGCRVRL